MLPVMGRAQALPATLTDTVSDCADLLTPAEEDTLTATFKAARSEIGVHITLATMGGFQILAGRGKGLKVMPKSCSMRGVWAIRCAMTGC